MKYIVIGGVAGGATTAARIRRTDGTGGNHLVGEGRIHFVCQLRSALLYRRCDCGAGETIRTDSRGFRSTF